MKQKKPKSKRSKQILSLLLIVAILVTGAFAFLSATDSKTNVFTVGKVNIKLHENFDTDLDGVAEQDPESTVVTEEIVPGQTILKQPYVENTGKNEAWIFVSVGIPTATEDDIYKDDNQNINIEGRTLSMDVKAYAIQTGFTGNANETAKAVWEKYVENKQTELFGDEFTGDKTTRIQLFKTMIQSGDTFSEGYNDTNWDKITNAYMSTNDHDYYVYAYKTTLAAPTNGNSPVTENVFDAVKLIEDIGEGKPITLNYMAVNDDVSVDSMSDLTIDDYHTIETELYAVGDTVETLYFDTALAKQNCSFDWINEETNAVAEEGMAIYKPTNLLANYKKSTSAEVTENIRYQIRGNIEDWYIEVIGVEEGTSFKSDSTFNIPTHIQMTTNDKGTFWNTKANPNFIKENNPGFHGFLNEWYHGSKEHSFDGFALTPNTTYNFKVSSVNLNNDDYTGLSDCTKIIAPDTVDRNFELYDSLNIESIALPYGTRYVILNNLPKLKDFNVPNKTQRLLITNLPAINEMKIPNSVYMLCFKGGTNSVIGLKKLVIPKNIMYLELGNGVMFKNLESLEMGNVDNSAGTSNVISLHSDYFPVLKSVTINGSVGTISIYKGLKMIVNGKCDRIDLGLSSQCDVYLSGNIKTIRKTLNASDIINIYYDKSEADFLSKFEDGNNITGVEVVDGKNVIIYSKDLPSNYIIHPNTTA